MEAPRHWRMSPANIGFRTESVTDSNNKLQSLRLPWGEIPLTGGIDEVYIRLASRGFNDKYIEEILFTVFGGVATESTVSSAEFVQGDLQLIGTEIREENRSKVEL